MPNYFVPTTDMIPAFDTRTNKEVGRLKINESVLIHSDGGVNHNFVFGAGLAYVSKSLTRIVTTPTTLSNYKSTTLPSKDDYISTNVIEKTIIYDYDHIQPIGTIAKDMQFPLIGGDSMGWYAIKVGDRIGKIRVQDVKVSVGVPVLCYHNVLEDSEYFVASTNIKLSVFTAQMDYLKNNGYTTITIPELEMFLNKQINLPTKAFVLTFDDGNKARYRYCYNILKTRGFTATEFYISNRLRDIPVETWNALANQTLVKSEVDAMRDIFAFENHTHALHFMENEPQQTAMVSRGYDEVKADMIINNSILGSKYLAYPFGGRDAEAIQAVTDSGVVSMAFTIDNGMVTIGSDKMQLKRKSINTYYDPIATFEKAVAV